MHKSILATALAGALLTTVSASAADLASSAPAASHANPLLMGGIASIYLGFIDYEEDQVDISDPQTQIIGGRGAVSIPFGSTSTTNSDFIR